MCACSFLLFQHHIELPQSSIPHTALSFNDIRPNELTVTQATNEFYVYDIPSKRLTDWTQQYASDFKMCKNFMQQHTRWRNVVYNPGTPDKALLYNNGVMAFVDVCKQSPTVKPKGGQKRKHHDKGQLNQWEKEKGIQYFQQYKEILFCDFMDRNVMVVVERPKYSVLEKLPPSFYRANFVS